MLYIPRKDSAMIIQLNSMAPDSFCKETPVCTSQFRDLSKQVDKEVSIVYCRAKTPVQVPEVKQWLQHRIASLLSGKEVGRKTPY